MFVAWLPCWTFFNFLFQRGRPANTIFNFSTLSNGPWCFPIWLWCSFLFFVQRVPTFFSGGLFWNPVVSLSFWDMLGIWYHFLLPPLHAHLWSQTVSWMFYSFSKWEADWSVWLDSSLKNVCIKLYVSSCRLGKLDVCKFSSVYLRAPGALHFGHFTYSTSSLWLMPASSSVSFSH